jgi:hypothetical protein
LEGRPVKPTHSSVDPECVRRNLSMAKRQIVSALIAV